MPPVAPAVGSESPRLAGAPLARLTAWRDRMVGNPSFRAWAARFPLTRPIARRRTRALFDLCAGFVYSQVLQACVELGVFDLLASGPRSQAALAARLGLAPDRADRLIGAAVSLKLLARRNGEVALGPLGAAMVDNHAVIAMVRHHKVLYADLADPVALLRADPGGTALARYWPYAGTTDPAALDDDQVAAYTSLMAASQPLVAAQILDAYDLSRHRRLLDVGGGEGAFLIEAAKRAPALRLMLFDLPAVVARADRCLAAAGLAGRAETTGGDLHAGALPGGADIVSLIRVIHDHDEAAALAILRAVRSALPPGGTLLLAEPMAGTRGAEPIGDAYFAFYLMALGSGRARTPEALGAMLEQAGFHRTRVVPTATPLLTSLIVAQT